MLAACLSEGSADAQNLGRDIVAWLSRVILPRRVRGTEIPEITRFDEFETYVEANMQTWTEQWKAEGMQEGIRQGMQKGMRDGKAEILASQIRRKFGDAATVGLREQLKAASLDQLDRWAERVLTAETPEDVIG